MIPEELKQAVKDALLRTRVIEYRDNLLSTRSQMQTLADAIEKRNGSATPLRDGIELYGIIANDLTKIINGEELKPFIVTGVL